MRGASPAIQAPNLPLGAPEGVIADMVTPEVLAAPVHTAERITGGERMQRSESLRPSSPNGAPPEVSGIGASEREDLYRDFQPLVRSLIARYGDEPEMRQDLPGEIYCRFCQLVADYDSS